MSKRIVHHRLRLFNIVLRWTSKPLLGLVLGRLVVEPSFGKWQFPTMTHWIVILSHGGDL